MPRVTAHKRPQQGRDRELLERYHGGESARDLAVRFRISVGRVHVIIKKKYLTGAT